MTTNRRSRSWLIVLGGALLPLPLIGLLGSSWVRTVQEMARPQEPMVLPMLHPVEREGTLTYGRECSTDSDCDPRLRCFFSEVTQSSYCTDSRCKTDRECREGFSCQTYAANNGRELLTKCSIVGVREEGEECEGPSVEPDTGCARGLLCHWACGRPCTPGAPSTCPDGFFCNAFLEGAACQPTCQGRTCPDGQRCIKLSQKTSVCAQVRGTDCKAVACGPERICMAQTYPWAPGEVWTQCTQECGFEDSPPCPEGTACTGHRCRPTCSPDGGAPCAERFKCTSRPNEPSVCAPDVADRYDSKD